MFTIKALWLLNLKCWICYGFRICYGFASDFFIYVFISVKQSVGKFIIPQLRNDTKFDTVSIEISTLLCLPNSLYQFL